MSLQTIPTSIDGPHYSDNDDNEAVKEALDCAEKLVYEKQQYQNIAKSNKKSLLLEFENLKDEYDKLKRLYSVNMMFHKDHIK